LPLESPREAVAVEADEAGISLFELIVISTGECEILIESENLVEGGSKVGEREEGVIYLDA
jgi:hypothetical protein